MGAEKLPNGQQATHVEDRGYGFRTGVQFPATPQTQKRHCSHSGVFCSKSQCFQRLRLKSF
nr:MAG TPA: hypothetical protein [Caudoviricetes sp.]